MKLLLAFAMLVSADAADVRLTLPGHPFKLAVSKDGEWVYASLLPQSRGDSQGIAVIRREGGALKLARTFPMKTPATGIVLTHDGKSLIVANGEGAVFLDVAKLRSGTGDPVTATVKESGEPQSIYVNITSDDKILFISEERAQAITVVDVAKTSIIGKIPVGNAPIALTFSPDEKLLYTTSQSAMPDWGWPAVCDPEGPAKPGAKKHPEGAVIVVDTAKARTDPAHSVVAKAHAGCNPVRLAISPRGDRIYVTARKSNAVLAFDAGTLVSNPDHAQIGSVDVGTAPVPVIVVGDRVIAGNSNRFGTAGSGDQALDVIDRNMMRVTGHIAAGQFPRDLVLTPDGHTLLLANFGSRSIQSIDIGN
jgi:DNA-binding beta-propeller fold protein YncE